MTKEEKAALKEEIKVQKQEIKDTKAAVALAAENYADAKVVLAELEARLAAG